MTVYYNEAEIFLKDFFNSINHQDTNEFDLLLIFDNASPKNLPSSKINIFELKFEHKLKQSEIRKEGIHYAKKNNYRNLIFSDIDDFFSNNRISLSIKELRKNDFVFNEISLVSQKGELIQENNSQKLYKIKGIQSYKQILDYNKFGLTNTGINLRSIKKNFFIPRDIVATDWWIFTILLLTGAIGEFIEGAHTFYRQYENNLVGLNKRMSSDSLAMGLLVKEIHYHHVCEYCKVNNLLKPFKEYEAKKEAIKELKVALEERDFRDSYVKVVNFNIEKIFKGWWSEIIVLNDWEKYAN